MAESKNRQGRYLSRRARNALLTAHIMMSVGLLGDSAGFLAVAIRAARADNPGTMAEMVRVLGRFAFVFGVPLSFGALLIISVMLVGGLVIGPALNATIQHGTNTTSRLIAAASYDVLALSVATGLSVFKPGTPLRSGAD